MQEISYSELKQNARNYEILLLRDQYADSFAGIAKKFGISTVRTRDLYYRIKYKQIQLYIRHIEEILGSSSQVKERCRDAKECYQDIACICGYLEKKYKDILSEYRNGEPGMPEAFLRSLPPLRPRLSQRTKAQIVQLHDEENATFPKIAKKLHITQAKAKHIYKMHYHRKVVKLVQRLQDRAKSTEEKWEIWDRYFHRNISMKRCYEILIQESDSNA